MLSRREFLIRAGILTGAVAVPSLCVGGVVHERKCRFNTIVPVFLRYPKAMDFNRLVMRHILNCGESFTDKQLDFKDICFEGSVHFEPLTWSVLYPHLPTESLRCDYSLWGDREVSVLEDVGVSSVQTYIYGFLFGESSDHLRRECQKMPEKMDFYGNVMPLYFAMTEMKSLATDWRGVLVREVEDMIMRLKNRHSWEKDYKPEPKELFPCSGRVVAKNQKEIL
jgi:hypothetical protein